MATLRPLAKTPVDADAPKHDHRDQRRECVATGDKAENEHQCAACSPPRVLADEEKWMLISDGSSALLTNFFATVARVGTTADSGKGGAHARNG